ncbi:hypothetical protein K1719_046347 [Acacia pycnantha]|nr:hypothetical protein K1719_046347 [Acacia pycnantha]
MLILDDVNHLSQLENLAGSRGWFGHGSRIIITTRDADLLRSHLVDKKGPPGVDEIYEIKPMSHVESHQLFCQKLFRGDPPTMRFLELIKSVIIYANGLPLALCVLGSFFSGLRKIEWEVALKMLKKDSNNDIFKVLRLSYDALNHVEKTIFLDIACFFNMWGKDEVTQILESRGLEATAGMKNLIDKSLLVEIELGNIKYIEMYDLVQEMGRLIVSDEWPDDLGRRSRLWCSHDIDLVLKRNMGTEATKCVVLPFTFEKDEANWNPASFLRMKLLQLLIISCNFSLPRGLMGLPWTLKVLHWYGYPSEALPSTEEMDQLVYLKMQNSKIKRLSIDTQSMYELKILDLSHSRNLLQTPNFLRFQNLKRLLLEGCISLVEIHSSLGQLPFLVELNLKDCLNLKFLPKKLETNSLEEFVISGCIQVINLPEFGEEMKKLITLDVKETSIAELPESLGSLTSVETLDLMGCQNLVGLPQNFHKLKCLKVLDISGCSSIFKLPENLIENEALEKLDASETNIVERHSFAKGLTLPAAIFNIVTLTELDFSYCNIVDGIIPNDLSGLSSLQRLDLSGNEFVSLPDGCVSNILNLKYLYLNSCPKLRFLPQPSPGLHLMDAGECGSLRTLSDKKLLHLFTSIEQDGQHADGSKRIASFSVTIPGSEIPSWFENQNNLPLNEKHVPFVTIDIPEGEWLGIGLCTLIDENICLPRWGFDFKAFDGKYVCCPGRAREHEKEIKSSHLWIVFWKIKEEHGDELRRQYSQIRLKFCTNWEQPPSRSVDIHSVKCGGRLICIGDRMIDDARMANMLKD